MITMSLQEAQQVINHYRSLKTVEREIDAQEYGCDELHVYQMVYAMPEGVLEQLYQMALQVVNLFTEEDLEGLTEDEMHQQCLGNFFNE